MELIYAYVEKFSELLEEQEFLFTQKFDVKYNKKNRKISIKKVEYVKNFFGNNVENLSLIIGKNGTGKSTTLDLLGMKMDDRIRNYNKYKDKYFLLYHIKNDVFAIDGCGIDLIEDIVNNLPLEDKYPIREPYSIVMNKANNDNHTYEYIGYMQNESDNNGKAINKKIIYVNIRDRFDKSISDRYSGLSVYKQDDYTTLVNRFYGSNIGIKEKYNFLNFLVINQKKLIIEHRGYEVDFFNTAVKMVIESKFNYYAEDEKKLDLKLPKKPLKSIFRKVKRLDENINESTLIDSKDIKQRFVLDFLENYIHESFNEGVLRNREDNKNKNDNIIIEIQKIIDSLYLSMENKDLYENQVKYLLEIIKKINDKIEEYIQLGNENMFYYSIEEFIEALEKINEDYFTSKNIKIPLKHGEELEVINLANILDKYIMHNDKNNLENNIKVMFKNLSEGELQFLNVFAKIRESLKNPNVRYGDTVILLLDEPDRSFHPEWARKFIPILLDNLRRLENVETKYQIIISTHSPFMVSDVPSNNLILLESTLNENNEKRCIVKRMRNVGKTFANNIHTILANEFFIKATVGEFSRKKIQESIKYMMEYKKWKDKNSEDIPSVFSEPNLSERKIEIKYIIDIIGEPLIKRKLEELFLKTFSEDGRDLKEEIMELQKEKAKLEHILKDEGLNDIENIMRLLNEKIRQLKDKVDVKYDINKM
ncbi:hypothetical protein FDG50_10020 [Clostridium botulinum]|uniref:AAA family ATPase n=1 Tax=Clostridium botulinum TaxID=1491 RepID=UPI00140040FE|nr:AAA family ATPase [Clostridium botulinum]MBY6838217.1 AAA family ATPase [Clostridium botulinum]NFG65107.1 hypothetical protein [Clostridium botulinum]NFQ24457.1 hypothetical protein [Clostridium botulinum]